MTPAADVAPPEYAERAEPAKPAVAVVIVAAGAGTRLGHGIPKALVPLAGEPLLGHALRGVLASDVARQIIVAVPQGDIALSGLCRAVGENLKASRGEPAITVVHGGAARADSVRAALAALLPGTERVLVHDAARPLTPSAVFRRVAAALAAGAAAVIPAVPVVDTIKSVAKTTDDDARAGEVVTGTLAREALRAVQTPQGFDAEALRRAHELADGWPSERAEAVTDDAMLVESLGLPVYVVPGDPRSFKITTPLDLQLAETLVRDERENTQAARQEEIR
ncbi:2-C-methyl-D-erythritol 4-phosphate cytidylyltransferase [Sinomonas sp. JGH33]|uniref:2-C-methyl-D-erythritol 4-phosphate cytidylyltransferase n=1 Tax=Sinomonas terricola TaxID=3110330 RepID=A0ABU5T9X8_9MICC|nr:2-C-methyl-D-erythritol 4-phosphate cytidylyltransferase [Sinomonas sp. JGH33]MEA5456478.1 2-C-methyl-D-erythritol 4-phosphate cytidylyltransferase [Sinomonas sp. JGH33]